MKFTATLGLRTQTATAIAVPPAVIDELGGGKRPRVVVTLKGGDTHSYSATIGIMAGDYLLPVSAEVRTAAEIAAGDAVEVEIALDTAPREVVVPDDLAAALGEVGGAREFFDAMSEGNRRRVVEQVTSAKTAATRERRVAKAIETMAAGAVR